MRPAAVFMSFALIAFPALAARDGGGMVEAIGIVIQHLCLSALVAIAVFAAMCFVADMGRRVMAKLPSVTLAVFLFVISVSSAILGSGKTNGLLQAILPFVPQVQQVQLPQVQPVVPPPVPRIAAPSPRASADMPFRARAWNRRGAWDDSFRCAFPGEWVFPHGTSHLDRVEVCSQGRILPRFGSTNVIASVGVPLQIVNPLTSFGCGPTDRNSYVFSWTNAVVGRVTREDLANAETVDASIELFRNGDVAVTTNGVTELRPRELPFPRDGYGQDDEWVTANFTNATEILAQGYTNWVCTATESETNGYFSLSVRIGDDPPETIQLKVGNYSVAVTNAGEYVFLLEKGVRHPIRLSYFLDDVEYAPIGGVHVPAEPSRGAIGSPGYSLKFVATGDDGGGLELEEPMADRDGHVLCWPWLSIAPAELTDPVFPVMFHADVFGIPVEATPNVTWVSGGQVIERGENLTLTGEEENVGDIAVTATYRDIALHGSVRVIRHVASSGITLGGGGLIVVEDAYTNSPGNVVAGSSTSAGLNLTWALSEAGTLCLSSDCAGVAVTNESGAAISLPHSWPVEADDEGEMSLSAFFPDPPAQTGNVGTFAFTFRPQDGGAVLSNAVQVQVVKVRVEAVADWPSNKVRHVFGVNESFRVYSGQGSILLSTNAPQVAGLHTVPVSISGTDYFLDIQAIVPSETIDFCFVREMTDADWAAEPLGKPPLTPLTPGVGYVAIKRLSPDYVNFKNIMIMEGYAAMTNQTGCFTNTVRFPPSVYSHGNAAGAGIVVGIAPQENLMADVDLIGVQFGDIPDYNGSYSLHIPVYWGVNSLTCTNRFSTSLMQVIATVVLDGENGAYLDTTVSKENTTYTRRCPDER